MDSVSSDYNDQNTVLCSKISTPLNEEVKFDLQMSHGRNVSQGQGRKRLRNEKNWKRNVRKQLRNTGKAYIDRKGKKHDAKKFIPRPANLKCSGSDCSNISENMYLSIFEQFWNMGDFNVQNAFILESISVKPVKRRRIPQDNDQSKRHDSSKVFSRNYQLSHGGVNYKVCKQCFLRTLQISSCRVNNVLKKFAGPSGVSLVDKWSLESNPHETSGEHLNSSPKLVSHYSRTDQKEYKYIHSDLAVRKLYLLYLENCNLENKIPVAFDTFNNIAKYDFNLSCPPLLKDACKQYDSWKS